MIAASYDGNQICESRKIAYNKLFKEIFRTFFVPNTMYSTLIFIPLARDSLEYDTQTEEDDSPK